METKLSLNKKTVTISPGQPFVLVGERINPTRRKKLAASMLEGDFSLVQDVNAGIPGRTSRPCCAPTPRP